MRQAVNCDVWYTSLKVMRPPSHKSAFTVLELLIVIVFVGFLAAIAIYALNITRASNRDAKRVSDVSVIRAALSQHWLRSATYPASGPIELGKPGNRADALTLSGFVEREAVNAPVFLQRVPTGPKVGEYYRYHGSAQGYSLRFKTERQTVYGSAGTWYAHADGVDKLDTEK